MFGLFKKRIKGLIGYFKLEDWWESTFSEQEKEYIKKKYQPLGLSSSQLTEENITSTSESSIAFLSTLASWFHSSHELPIAQKILKKAEEISLQDCKSVLDAHFMYMEKIKIFYKQRDTNPEALDLAIKACKQQIAIAIKSARSFKHSWGELPTHTGYEQLAIIYDKQKEYQEAIDVCKEANKQGWAGSWGKRIERYQKKLNNS